MYVPVLYAASLIAVHILLYLRLVQAKGTGCFMMQTRQGAVQDQDKPFCVIGQSNRCLLIVFFFFSTCTIDMLLGV